MVYRVFLKQGVALRLRMSMLHAAVKLFRSVHQSNALITPGPSEVEVPHMHIYLHRATHCTTQSLLILLYYCQVSPSVQKCSFVSHSIYP